MMQAALFGGKASVERRDPFDGLGVRRGAEAVAAARGASGERRAVATADAARGSATQHACEQAAAAAMGLAERPRPHVEGKEVARPRWLYDVANADYTDTTIRPRRLPPCLLLYTV